MPGKDNSWVKVPKRAALNFESLVHSETAVWTIDSCVKENTWTDKVMKRLKWGRSTNSPTNSLYSPTCLLTNLIELFSTTLCQKIDIKDKLLIISLLWKELIWSEHQDIFIVRCGCRPVELFFFYGIKPLKNARSQLTPTAATVIP